MYFFSDLPCVYIHVPLVGNDRFIGGNGFSSTLLGPKPISITPGRRNFDIKICQKIGHFA